MNNNTLKAIRREAEAMFPEGQYKVVRERAGRREIVAIGLTAERAREWAEPYGLKVEPIEKRH